MTTRRAALGALGAAGFMAGVRFAAAEEPVPAGSAVDVRDHGSVADDTTDNSDAFEAAIAAAVAGGRYAPLYVPKGSYRLSRTINYPWIIGDGPRLSYLRHTGTDACVRMGTPGVRSYSGHLSGLAISSTGGGTYAIDADAHSVGVFDRLLVGGADVALNLGSAVDGATLYNTFLACEFTGSRIGVQIGGQSSNENRFISCRTNANTEWAVKITGGNRNLFHGCAFEGTSGQGAVYISNAESDSGRCQVVSSRFESNSGYAVWVNPGVLATVLAFNDFISTGGTVRDEGTRTTRIGNDAAGAEVVRGRGMGTDQTPVFAVRDTYSAAGSPVAFEVQQSRWQGRYLQGVTSPGGTPVWWINGDGVIKTLATTALPSAARAGVGGMAYHPALRKPVWSDGTAWRDADGTAL